MNPMIFGEGRPQGDDLHAACPPARGGFIMITGQPGTGKTTLVSDLVAYSFNLDPEGCSKAKVLFQVEDFLKQEYQQGLLRVSRLLLHSRQTRTLRTSLRRTSKNQQEPTC